MNKKLKSLLLLLSLLVHQTTEPFSWDWASDLYTRASTAVSSYLTFEQGTLDQIKGAGFMLGLGALVAGIFYLKNKHDRQEAGVTLRRKTSSHTDEGYKGTFEVAETGSEIVVQQLQVKSQLDLDGGGNASCGYHAIKNSFIYGLALQDNLYLLADILGSPLGDYKEALKNIEIIKSLFGKDGIWRKQIITQELLAQLKNDLRKQFDYKKVEADGHAVRVGVETYPLKSLKISSKYQSFLPEFIASIASNDASEMIEKKTFSKQFANFIWDKYQEISIDRAIEYLYERPVKESAIAIENIYHLKSIEDPNPMKAVLWEHLTNVDTIDKYLSLKENIEIHRDGDNVLMNIGDKWHVVKKSSGEWIGNDHVNFLCKQLNQVLAENKLPVIIVPDVKDLHRKDSSDVPRKINKLMKTLVKHDNYVQAFIIGTMDQHKVGRGGHWISVVFEKNKDQHTYTVMDSLGGNKIESPLVKKLVSHVETKFHQLK